MIKNRYKTLLVVFLLSLNRQRGVQHREEDCSKNSPCELRKIMDIQMKMLPNAVSRRNPEKKGVSLFTMRPPKTS